MSDERKEIDKIRARLDMGDKEVSHMIELFGEKAVLEVMRTLDALEEIDDVSERNRVLDKFLGGNEPK